MVLSCYSKKWKTDEQYAKAQPIRVLIIIRFYGLLLDFRYEFRVFEQ